MGRRVGRWIEADFICSPVNLLAKRASGHKSIDQRETALGLAKCCVGKFKEPVASFQAIEERANHELELLIKR